MQPDSEAAERAIQTSFIMGSGERRDWAARVARRLGPAFCDLLRTLNYVHTR